MTSYVTAERVPVEHSIIVLQKLRQCTRLQNLTIYLGHVYNETSLNAILDHT